MPEETNNVEPLLEDPIIPAIPKVVIGNETKFTMVPTFIPLVEDDNGVTLDTKLASYEEAVNNLGPVMESAKALLKEVNQLEEICR
jgi:hypothetical protein